MGCEKTFKNLLLYQIILNNENSSGQVNLPLFGPGNKAGSFPYR